MLLGRVDDRLLVLRVPHLGDAREVRVEARDRVVDRGAAVGFGRREAPLELHVVDVDDDVVRDLVRAARVDAVDLVLVADHEVDGEARIGGRADREGAHAAERRSGCARPLTPVVAPVPSAAKPNGRVAAGEQS